MSFFYLQNSKKGFSLIEIIIVIVILSILLTLAIPKYLSLREKAIEATENAVIAAVKEGIHIQHMKEILQ